MFMRFKRYDRKKQYKVGLIYVYILYCNGEVIYVGKARNLKARLWFHNTNKEFDTCFYTAYNEWWLSERLEKSLIRNMQPKLNTHYKKSEKSNIELSDWYYKNRIDLR